MCILEFQVYSVFLNLIALLVHIVQSPIYRILALIAVYSIIFTVQRIRRIKNICKELNVSQIDYKNLVDKFYYDNYFPDIKDYIYSLIEEQEEKENKI